VERQRFWAAVLRLMPLVRVASPSVRRRRGCSRLLPCVQIARTRRYSVAGVGDQHVSYTGHLLCSPGLASYTVPVDGEIPST
jgi:hypothetical protein